MTLKVILLIMMPVGLLSSPQGPAYLPPAGQPRPGNPQPSGGHPDEWAGDPVNYEFEYEVEDALNALNFGHQESRKDEEATGSYHVLLPDGRTQIVDYVADRQGYRPMVRYEGVASYPAPSRPAVVTGGTSADEGYRY